MKNNNIKGKLVIIATLALMCLESSAWPWSRQTQPNNANSYTSEAFNNNPDLMLNNITPSSSRRGSDVFSQGSAWTSSTRRSSVASSQSSIASNSNPNSLLNNTPPPSYPSSPNSSMGGSTGSLPPYDSLPPPYYGQDNQVMNSDGYQPSAPPSYDGQNYPGVNSFYQPSAPQQSYGNQNYQPSDPQQPYGNQRMNFGVNQPSAPPSYDGQNYPGVNSFYQPSAPQQPYGNQNYQPSDPQQPYGNQGYQQVDPLAQKYKYVLKINSKYFGSANGVDKWFAYDANSKPRLDARVGLAIQREGFFKGKIIEGERNDIRFFISGTAKYFSQDGNTWYNVSGRGEKREFSAILKDERSSNASNRR